ncbi:hypothetical protein jhhlp_000500 [Lomentospora prolificans]|uniref:Uncharacterized protein n=1 Tax=Lomentospora prolificans TaxID=41688 RepID=A0A2N3NL74_9PEZI|nr:hypothetical protein jhhlp_000500 [Lomentospora prolificans]
MRKLFKPSSKSGSSAEVNPEADTQILPSPPLRPRILDLSDQTDTLATTSLSARTLPSRSLIQATQANQEPDRRGSLTSIAASITHKRRRSRDVRDDPLGLVVLHSPVDRSVDILFIHGLGGSSLRTWCRDKDLDFLWPQFWLPQEIPTARILTFGYNANFQSKREKASLTISDFAADLLFRMKHEESGDVRLGQVPIIVVAHSMGGLVFKKAFIYGHMSNEFSSIVSCIKAVLFLATPHRGTDLADTLHAILASSMLGHSTKDYVLELARRSPTIDELNETFRHHASKLRLFSFYETLTTALGPISAMILDKNSSVMGYPNETPQPLVANHHNVCKFTSTNDPNYTSVVGALRSVANALSQQPIGDSDNKEEDDLRQIRTLLGVSGPPEDSFSAVRALRKTGTCAGFLSCPEMETWLSGESAHILWAHASPGSGKSILCSFVVDSLLRQGRHCAYFFFKYGSRQTQSVAHMLRSLAYQMALISPEFRRNLTQIAHSRSKIDRADATMVWETLFAPSAAQAEISRPIFWVIDAIDESESFKQVIDFASRTSGFGSPIHILTFSRPLAAITKTFQLTKKRIPVVDISLPDNAHDIRLVVSGEIDYLPSNDEFKVETVDEITSRAQGNFLWASLVLKRVTRCLRQEQVKRVLESTPDGMDRLYDRMFDVVSSLDVGEDQALAEILLLWAMYAETPLTIDEFSEAYPTQMNSIMDFQHTVSEVSGQFVVINANNAMVLVHHSAREYLRKSKHQWFSLEPKNANERLFCKCIEALCDGRLRRKLMKAEIPKFLQYAATSWAFHLQYSPAGSDRTLDMLVKFFNGPFPLSWLQYLAMSGQLSDLVRASRILTKFAREKRKADAEKSPMLHRLSDLALIETWAIDLMKIPAKFGRHLYEDPLFIYKCVPPLSPQCSIIHQKFSANPAATLSVCGRSNPEWDDCLARVSANPSRALRLAASSLYLAVVSDTPKGTITIWDTNLFVEHQSFNIGEHVWALSFNKSGSLLACYGVSRTFVWKMDDGSLQLTVTNPLQERAIEFNFDGNDTILMVSDVREIYELVLQPSLEQTYWSRKSPELLDEPGVPEGTFLSTPSCVAFNGDCSQIAVAYRSFPLSIWNVDPPEMVARLKRKFKQGEAAVNSYTGDNKVVWHPSGNLVIGIYGQIFKWSPVDGTYEEVKGETGVIPHGLQCSPNGLVFITSDVEGSIKIYDISSMALIYKLSSEDSINQICFSPDSLRFYDLRGCYCNIWEPNCLARLADSAITEQISDADSAADSFWSDADDVHSTAISLPTSESQADSKPAICAIASGTKSTEQIAYANESGVVEIYDPANDQRYVVVRTLFGTKAEQVAWNAQHDRLAYSLSNGGLAVISMSVSSEQEVSIKSWYVERKPTARRGRTRQLILNSTGDLLLVLGTEICQILAIPSGEVIAETVLFRNHSATWTQHPDDPGLLICAYANSLVVYTWELEQQQARQLRIVDDDAEPPEIDEFLSSHSSKFLLLRTVTATLGRTSYSFVVLPTDSLYLNDTISKSTDFVTPLCLPDSIRKIAQHPVGILADGRLVFLDKSLRVCTWDLWENANDNTVTRHFFLPHDWVTSSGIQLCRVLRDGTLLCPSKGEIAIMKSDLMTNQ